MVFKLPLNQDERKNEYSYLSSICELEENVNVEIKRLNWSESYKSLTHTDTKKLDFFLLASSPIPLTFLRPYIPLLHTLGCNRLCVPFKANHTHTHTHTDTDTHVHTHARMHTHTGTHTDTCKQSWRKLAGP